MTRTKLLSTSQAGIAAQGMNPRVIEAMREHVHECTWGDVGQTVDVSELTDGEIVAGIDRTYCGGVDAFLMTWEADYGTSPWSFETKGVKS